MPSVAQVTEMALQAAAAAAPLSHDKRVQAAASNLQVATENFIASVDADQTGAVGAPAAAATNETQHKAPAPAAAAAGETKDKKNHHPASAAAEVPTKFKWPAGAASTEPAAAATGHSETESSDSDDDSEDEEAEEIFKKRWSPNSQMHRKQHRRPKSQMHAQQHPQNQAGANLRLRMCPVIISGSVRRVCVDVCRLRCPWESNPTGPPIGRQYGCR